MKANELSQNQVVKVRVGAVPYWIDDTGSISFYTMIPSNENFGGTSPQIAKGIYEGEDSLKNEGLREAEEELGLKPKNIREVFHAFTKRTQTKRGIHEFHVWAVNILDKEDFKKPHWETGETHWIDASEIKERVRRDHQIPMWNILRQVKNKHNL